MLGYKFYRNYNHTHMKTTLTLSNETFFETFLMETCQNLQLWWVGGLGGVLGELGPFEALEVCQNVQRLRKVKCDQTEVCKTKKKKDPISVCLM